VKRLQQYQRFDIFQQNFYICQ